MSAEDSCSCVVYEGRPWKVSYRPPWGWHSRLLSGILSSVWRRTASCIVLTDRWTVELSEFSNERWPAVDTEVGVHCKFLDRKASVSHSTTEISRTPFQWVFTSIWEFTEDKSRIARRVMQTCICKFLFSFHKYTSSWRLKDFWGFKSASDVAAFHLPTLRAISYAHVLPKVKWFLCPVSGSSFVSLSEGARFCYSGSCWPLWWWCWKLPVFQGLRADVEPGAFTLVPALEMHVAHVIVLLGGANWRCVQHWKVCHFLEVFSDGRRICLQRENLSV